MLLLLSHFSRVRLCATLWTAAHQALPFLGFSRQEHWSGLPFPSLMHKCSFGISNFLEEISSLSPSIVFLYFFALITEEGFLISPCNYLKLCVQMDISFLFSFVFTSLFFTSICKASSDIQFFRLGLFRSI